MEKGIEGTNMIEVRVYFHTTIGRRRLESKTATKDGVVYMPANKKHGINSSPSMGFGGTQGTMDIVIKKCLKKNKINFVDNHGEKLDTDKI